MTAIHLDQKPGGFEVWLDTEAEADTLLLGIGATRDEALACAEAHVQAAIAEAWEDALGKLRAMRRETRGAKNL
jgi:hypothetical protein